MKLVVWVLLAQMPCGAPTHCALQYLGLFLSEHGCEAELEAWRFDGPPKNTLICRRVENWDHIYPVP